MKTIQRAGAAFFLLATIGCQSNRPPGKFDPNEIPGYVTRLNRSHHPEALRIKKELANGAAALAAERAAAKREGIPVSPADLQKPPIPAARNAAPLYRQLGALLKARPLSKPGSRSLLEYPMGPRSV